MNVDFCERKPTGLVATLLDCDILVSERNQGTFLGQVSLFSGILTFVGY